MGELARGICAAHGAEVEYSYKRVFHATTNSENETLNAHKAALATNADELIEYPCEAMTASEDFAHMLLDKPGCYIFIGNGTDSEGGCMLHNPHYDFNDKILTTGVRYWVNLTLQQLS